MANADALHRLQAGLLAGACSKKSQRAPFTVRTYMAAVMAALSWAEFMEWIPKVPRIKKIRVAKLRHMKGRPITTEEFERMLLVTSAVVGDKSADS